MKKKPSTSQPKQKRAVKTREKIISSAMELFSVSGFEAATTTAIAQKAEVSVGSVYSHFEDKYEIFLEGIEHYYVQLLERITDDILTIPAQPDSPGTLIRYYIGRTYEVYIQKGKLNQEIEKFVMMDARAKNIDATYQEKEEEIMRSTFKKLKGLLRIDDIDTAVTLYHRFLHASFSHLYQNCDTLDTESYLDTMADMMKGALIKPEYY